MNPSPFRKNEQSVLFSYTFFSLSMFGIQRIRHWVCAVAVLHVCWAFIPMRDIQHVYHHGQPLLVSLAEPQCSTGHRVITNLESNTRWFHSRVVNRTGVDSWAKPQAPGPSPDTVRIVGSPIQADSIRETEDRWVGDDPYVWYVPDTSRPRAFDVDRLYWSCDHGNPEERGECLVHVMDQPVSPTLHFEPQEWQDLLIHTIYSLMPMLAGWTWIWALCVRGTL